MSGQVYDFKWMGHVETLRLIEISGELTTVDPLRVGAGRVFDLGAPTDLLVVKVRKHGREVPVIPGSSWKGVFRSYSVALLRSLEVRNVCDGIPRATCLRGNEWDEVPYWGDKLARIVRGEIRVCLACAVYGSPSLLSHVTFDDGVPVSVEEPVSYRLGYRTGIAINRRTGTVSGRALYTIEYVEPDSRFTFRLLAKNLPNYALGLIAEVIKDLDEGLVRVGGFKSRGFGRVKFGKLNVKVLMNRKGSSTELAPLDPMDELVRLSGDACEDLKALSEVFYKKLPKIKEVSERGWRWLD